MSDMIASRRGYVMAEAIVVLALTMLIGVTLCSALEMQSRLARSVGERIAHNDAARVAMHIVPSELRSSDPRSDIRASASDSIAARWFRGSGPVCDVSGTAVWIRMRTMREPDPAKDSLLLIGPTGDEKTAAISSVASDPAHCPGADGGEVYRINVGPVSPASDPVAAMFFESGSYYLSQRALRYRLGGEGRQPLTEEFMRDAGSSFALSVDTLGASTFHIQILLKPGMQYATGRSRQLTVFLPNRARGS
jgi:hypothetical protein